MNASLLQQVCQIAADVFNLPLEAVTAQSARDTIGSWDSLNHVNLVLALEQHFHLQFLPDEIMQMSSIELITLLVEAKLSRLQRGGR